MREFSADSEFSSIVLLLLRPGSPYYGGSWITGPRIRCRIFVTGPSGTVAYEYDSDENLAGGNVTSTLHWTYFWNGLGNLLSTVNNTGVQGWYEYDRLSRRGGVLGRLRHDPLRLSETRVLYDGNDHV